MTTSFIHSKITFSSQSVDCRLLQTLSVCVCLSVCPAFTAYISFTMSCILIKLGENVLTSVQLIVSNFSCATPLWLCAYWVKGLNFFLHFYAFQRILSRSRHTFCFENFRDPEAQNARVKQARCECEYATPDCDISNSDLLVIIKILSLFTRCLTIQGEFSFPMVLVLCI